jgi:DNA-binding transcriptional LysR family regulator
MDLLLAGDVDLAVIDEYDYLPIALADHLEVRRLRVEPLVAVLPVKSRISAGAVRLSDLQNWNWVMPPDDAACGFAVRSACRAAGFEPRVRWETDDMLLLTRAVAAGHGVAVLPRLSVDAETAAVDVRALAEPALRRTLSVVGRAVNLRRPVIASVAAAIEAAATQ